MGAADMAERDYRQEHRAIMRALAESVADASDADILEDAQSAEEDPLKTAEGVRQVLLDGLGKFRKKRLAEARSSYERDVGAFGDTAGFLPASIEACRELLRRVFEEKPEYGEALLTAQHREFRSLSDDDVVSYLTQLHVLGVLRILKKDG